MDRKAHVGAIDGLRAIAVLAVVFHHVTMLVPSAGAIEACGARGVDLFFTISGFCLSYPFLVKRRERGSVHVPLARFYIRRFGRVAPPYYAALILFTLLAFTPFGLPTAHLQHVAPAATLRDASLDFAFLTNRAPLLDASFWTLGLEMRWYLLFPFILRLYMRSRLGFAALGAGCYALYASPWSIADAGTLPCFMLGIVAADLMLERHRVCRFAVPVAAVAVVCAIRQQLATHAVDHGNALWHAAAFLTVLASSDPLVARMLRVPPLAFVGVASYSIYLVHEPVIDGLMAASVHPIAAFVVSIACGVAFYGAVERPALLPKVRAFIEASLVRIPTMRRVTTSS